MASIEAWILRIRTYNLPRSSSARQIGQPRIAHLPARPAPGGGISITSGTSRTFARSAWSFSIEKMQLIQNVVSVRFALIVRMRKIGLRSANVPAAIRVSP